MNMIDISLVARGGKFHLIPAPKVHNIPVLGHSPALHSQYRMNIVYPTKIHAICIPHNIRTRYLIIFSQLWEHRRFLADSGACKEDYKIKDRREELGMKSHPSFFLR